MISTRFYKALCLALLISGYQSAAFCFSTLEYVLGAATGTFFLGAVYYKLRYAAYYKRFEELALVRDAYDLAQSARDSEFKSFFVAYEAHESSGQRADEMRTLLASRWDSAQHEQGKLKGLNLDSAKLERTLADLAQAKRELEAKKVLWADDASKGLLIVQLTIALRELNYVIEVLRFTAMQVDAVRKDIADSIN